MKIVFMGTPDFAASALDALIQAGHEISLVVTQPDKPKGRSKELMPSPVKVCALKYDLPVFQPVRIKTAENVEYLIVDTSIIPNFDRFLYKLSAIERGDLQKAQNFGTNTLEKAIELKKAGHPIRIVTREHVEACIATKAFEEKVVGPTKAELRAMEAQKEREAKKAKKACCIQI